jgi:hypothetical protein
LPPSQWVWGIRPLNKRDQRNPQNKTLSHGDFQIWNSALSINPCHHSRHKNPIHNRCNYYQLAGRGCGIYIVVTAACVRGVKPSRKYTAAFSPSKGNHGTTVRKTATGVEHNRRAAAVLQGSLVTSASKGATPTANQSTAKEDGSLQHQRHANGPLQQQIPN